MTKNCDALAHTLEKVPLATLINQTNAKFSPPEQEFETCFANAIAAMLHLAMHRIVGQEGGYLESENIHQYLVDPHGCCHHRSSAGKNMHFNNSGLYFCFNRFLY